MSYTGTPPIKPSHFESGTAEFILTGSDILRDNPQLLGKYFKQNGLKPTFLQKLRALGFARRVEGPITEHYEKPRDTHTFTVGSVVLAPTAPKEGKNITIALSAGDMYTYTDGNGNTRKGSRPRKTEVWQFADRQNYRIIDKITSTDPHQIVLRPRNTTIDASVAIVEGAKAFYVSTLSGEATGQPSPLSPRNFKYQNTFAIVKETDLVSGTGMTTGVAFKPVDGKPNYFWLQGLEDAEVRHERNKSYTCIHGQKSDNLEDYSQPFDTDVSIPGTEGFLEFVTTWGYEDTYSNLNSVTIDDFYELAQYFHDINISGNEIGLIQGNRYNAKIEKLLVDFLSNTYVDYVGKTYMGKMIAESGMSAEEMFVTLGFAGFHLNKMNFLQFSLSELDDTEGGGVSGFTYNQWQIAFPLGFFKNKKGNELLPTMGYEWRGNSMGYERENEVWKNGGAGPSMVVKSSEFDVMNSYFRSEIAPHFALGAQFHVSRPEDAYDA